MNSRERVSAVLNGKKPDRLPFNFWMDRNLMAELDIKLGAEFRINHYGADIQESYFGFDYNCGLPIHTKSDHKTTWFIAPTLEDMSKVYQLNFPEVKESDESFYQNIINDRKRLPEIAIFAMTVTPLEMLLNIRLMENAMVDMYEYPSEVEFFINECAKRQLVLVKGLKRYLDKIDVLYLAGDICSSKGAMFSQSMLRQYCFEPIKPIIAEAHKLGLKVFMHSDGNLADVLPLYVEYGIDGCNPLQPHVNDANDFYKKYKGKLMLYGGIDNCFAIPDSDENGVKNHILSQYQILGKEGGLIFSSHDIPDYVKLSNIDKMVETIKKIIP